MIYASVIELRARKRLKKVVLAISFSHTNVNVRNSNTPVKRLKKEKIKEKKE